MNHRRAVLKTIGGFALVPLLRRAQAQAFPTRSVTLIAPFTTGQSTDILARLVADSLAKQWSVGVIVDNRPGAGGALGAQIVIRAAPDGYTLLVGSSGTITIGPHLNLAANYDPRTNLTPIMNVADVGLALVVSASSPFKTVQDFIAAAKASPGKLNYGSNGNGSTQHLAMELLKQRAGLDIQHVPYKGSGPAYVDLLGKRIDALFDGLSAAIELAKSGQVRLLAVSSAKRDPALPDVPTIGESGIADYAVSGWIGILGPAKMNPALRNRINEDLGKMIANEGVQQNMAKLGLRPVGGSADDFARFIAKEYARWGEVIKTAGIKPE